MMRKLASFIMLGPWQAAIFMASTAVLALLLPPLLVVSGAALTLVTLRRGVEPGVKLLVLASMGGAALAYLSIRSAAPIASFTLLYWLPLLGLSLVLRQSVSLGRSLQVAAAFGLLLVPVFFWVFGDPQEWVPPLAQELGRWLVENDALTAKQSQEAVASVELLAPYLPGQLIASLILMLVLSLFLGRWWQSLLFNPGGFRSEFHELRLGQPMAVVALLLIGVALFSGQQFPVPLIGNLSLLLGIIYLIQGTALVHGLVAKLGLSSLWLIGFYLLALSALSQLVVMFALIDAWADFRSRIKPTTGVS